MTNPEAQLKALMIRGLNGDRAAYAELLGLLTPFLRGIIGRRLGAQSAEAEDLVQEALLAIHVKRQTYDRAQPFTPWAYAIARYKLLDHFRRAGVRRSIPLEDAGDLFATGNPEEGAVRRDVTRLLEFLPERQRALMRDVKLTGLSISEAAERGGMSETAAKVSLHRGMQRLMRRVADENR